MNGLLDPTKLSENELALLENFTLKSYGNVGSLVSRNGFTRYNTNQIASGGSGVGSMFEVTLNGVDYMIANIINAGSSGLYYEDSPYTGTWTAITGANGSAQAYKVNYASFRDKVYITNRGGGTLTNAVWDGTTAGFYDMGCPPCNGADVTITGGTVTGGLTSGSAYIYMVTFLYDGQQESSAFSATGSISAPVTGSIDLSTIPVSANARCTARKIYRTKAGGGTSYYYLTTINDNTTTTYTDTVSDNVLTDPRDYSEILNISKPQYAKYICIHKERAVLGNLTESFLRPLVTGDITLTPSNGAGSLTSSTTYNYRFYKIYVLSDTAPAYLAVPVLSKSVVMGASDDTVTISYAGADPFVKYIAIERAGAGAGSTDYKLMSVISPDSLLWNTGGNYTDLVADGSRSSYTVQHRGSIRVAETNITSYPGNIKISDAGKPDLFSTVETAADGTLIPASNEWNIGEPITGIHSEENRIIIFSDKNIYQLDTTAQSKQFWRLDKIVSGIGSDAGLQCQVGNGYVFVNTGKPEGTNSSVEKIYYWDGRSKPRSISDKIIHYCLINSITEYKDLAYDSANENVQIIATNTDGTVTYVLQYGLNTGDWEIYTNATNLNFKCLTYTKSYGLLIGGGDGYVHYQKATQYQDVIAGTNRTFTTKLRTKTFTTYDTDIRPEMFRADITATGAVTPVLKTAVDGTLNSGDNMTALASGFNRPRQNSFTNAQDKGYRQVYFQLEMTANELQKVHGLYIDLKEENGIGR